MRQVLVTGGAGFIGSNFIRYLLKTHKDISIVNLDCLTYAGNPANLRDCADDSRYQFVLGRVEDCALLDRLFRQYQFDTIVHFAAESHVDRSIAEPGVFLTTNVIGTQALLDAAKTHWKQEPEDAYSNLYRAGVKFLQVSTDEVYGALGPEGLFSESTPLAPNSPYSASKAAADLVALAYYRTYKLPVNITRCSNNYGPYQYPEKLIPLMISNALSDKPLPVYGDGLQIRDWLHVHDHCTAIELVVERGRPGEVYNIGGRSERKNIEIVKLILQELNKPESLITYVRDRLGHDWRYAIDPAKIMTELGWNPTYSFETGIRETIRWYASHPEWLRAGEEQRL